MQVKAGGEAFEVVPLDAVENGWAYEVTPPSGESFRITVQLTPTAAKSYLPWRGKSFFPGTIRTDIAPAFGAINSYAGALRPIWALLEETDRRGSVTLQIDSQGRVLILDPGGNKQRLEYRYY